MSKAIDKAAGAEREVVGTNKFAHLNGKANSTCYGTASRPNETTPATEAAQQWQGWGTALKPALEPVTVARKPLIGTVAANVLEHGTGALNVDGCRVEHGGESLRGGMNSENYGNHVHEGWDRPWRNDGTTLTAARERSNANQERSEHRCLPY